MFHLQYAWGIERFESEFGKMGLNPQNPAKNVFEIIKKFSKGTDFFVQYHKERIKGMVGNRDIKTWGLLSKITEKYDIVPWTIFDTYSYRGIYSAETSFEKILVSNYPRGMVEMSMDLHEAGLYDRAIALSEKALKMPFVGDRGAMYYNLSILYNISGRSDEAGKYIKTAVRSDTAPCVAFETAGKIYYNEANYVMSLTMFEKAIKCGSSNELLIKRYIDEIKKTNPDL